MVIKVFTVCYHPQRSWGKVMFLQVCMILFTGGVPDQVHPPQDQVHPPGPGTPPRTRYTPWDQVHPLGPGTPQDQVHLPWDQVHPSPGPGRPPRTRYTPLEPGTPPRLIQIFFNSNFFLNSNFFNSNFLKFKCFFQNIFSRISFNKIFFWMNYFIPNPPPPPPPGAREIRSTRRRYASYWNAFLLILKCIKKITRESRRVLLSKRRFMKTIVPLILLRLNNNTKNFPHISLHWPKILKWLIWKSISIS